MLHDTKHFFVQRTGQPYLELAARNYLRRQNGTLGIADGNNYKGELLLYFGDCGAATSLLPTTLFTAEGLTRVVQAYNAQCSPARRAGQEIVPLNQAQRPRVAVRLGLMAGLRYNSLRFDRQGQEGAVLHGRNADGQAHPHAGLYADVVSGGRRLAFHSALLASGFGRAQPVAFAATPNTPAGSYEWHGTQVVLQFGLRGLLLVGPQVQLLVGAGYEINSFWNTSSVFTFDNQPGDFLFAFRGTPLPYLEVGASRKRLAVTLNGRVYEPDYFTHPFSAAGKISSVTYTYTPWSLSLALSYRLNADSDAPR